MVGWFGFVLNVCSIGGFGSCLFRVMVLLCLGFGLGWSGFLVDMVWFVAGL